MWLYTCSLSSLKADHIFEFFPEDYLRWAPRVAARAPWQPCFSGFAAFGSKTPISHKVFDTSITDGELPDVLKYQR